MIGRAHNWSVATDELIYMDQKSISEEALPYIHALQEKGFMIGYEDGTFRPESNVLRETAAVIMANLIR